MLFLQGMIACLDTLDRTIGDRRHVVTVELTVRPIVDRGGSCEIAIKKELGEQLSRDMKDAVENGVHSSYLQGHNIST